MQKQDHKTRNEDFLLFCPPKTHLRAKEDEKKQNKNFLFPLDSRVCKKKKTKPETRIMFSMFLSLLGFSCVQNRTKKFERRTLHFSIPLRLTCVQKRTGKKSKDFLSPQDSHFGAKKILQNPKRGLSIPLKTHSCEKKTRLEKQTEDFLPPSDSLVCEKTPDEILKEEFPSLYPSQNQSCEKKAPQRAKKVGRLFVIFCLELTCFV